ncbi:MAG: hypothetical protein WC841_03290 [Candidatus Shapirobacteria bacterium]|jgi:hypothetical protein
MGSESGGGWRPVVAGMLVIAAATLGTGLNGNNENGVQAKNKVTEVSPSKTLKPTYTAIPTATPTVTSTPTQTPEPVPSAKPTEVFQSTIEMGGITMFYGSSGSIAYQIGDEPKMFIDKQEIVKARNVARKEHEYQVIALIEAPEPGPDTYKPSEDRPLFNELPPDVVSPEDLERRGIKVINGAVELHIREMAFDADGPLAEYQPGGQKKLIVAMVDEPTFSPDSLNDQRYEEIRELAGPAYKSIGGEESAGIEEYRQQELTAMEFQLSQARGEKMDDTTLQSIKVSQRFLQDASEGQLREWMSKETNFGGVMVPASMVEEIIGLKNTDVIVICTGKSRIGNYWAVGVDGRGKYSTQLVPLGARRNVNGRPKISQSRPRASDFSISDEGTGKTYATDDRTLPLNLWHELVHLLKPGIGERATDVEAINHWIQEYFERGESPFLFSVPDRGGYIQAKNEKGKAAQFFA